MHMRQKITREEPIMDIANTIRPFFTQIQKGRDGIKERIRDLEEKIERCHTKPANARGDSNMYMSADGRVWKWGLNHMTEVRRTWNPFWYVVAFFCGWDFKYAPFIELDTLYCTREDTEIRGGSVCRVGDIIFIKRSWCEEEFEDWHWEISFPWGRHRRGTTISYWQGCLESARRSLAFHEAILANREAIGKWMVEDVCTRDRSEPETFQGDWDELYERFIPKSLTIRDCPQGYSLVQLSTVLDALAGVTGRIYLC